ncbi:MAG TPA: serine/threonine-protein kinase, partial [Kofleriaceae bacterium]
MSATRDDTDDGDLRLLKALAHTPSVAPFRGTDRYDVHACLGEGGFGVVYEVEDRSTSRRLALKTLKPQRSGFEANIRRLKREFRSVADLVHSNLVGLHELSSHGTRWFFTMDLVRGCDFRQYVRAGDVLDEPRLRGAIAQLVDGVAALHQAGVLHRDLKPSNVLVDADGHVVILDFGLAGDDIDPGLYAAGTPSFMSPEQLAGRVATPASDWYSVGVMLHEALTGTVPSAERDVLATAPVPADLRRLCAALLRVEPSERPTAIEIRAALGRASEPGEPLLGETRFVGRERELLWLREAYASMRDRMTRVVRVTGEPGVGKSSLLARFRAELPDDAVVLASKCHERESVPFKAFDGVVDLLVAHLKSHSRGELLAVLPHDIELATQLFPVLGELDAVRELRRGAVPADPAELRARSFRALKELVASLAASRPLVIVIDDLQWGDIDSARLLLAMLAPPQTRMLVVLAYRSDDATASSTLRETLRLLDAAGMIDDTVALGALPGPEARELAALLVGEGAAAKTIAAHGEGHPLFMLELARGVARREALDEIPNLIDMLWRRVDRLAPQARALVETVAIAGGPLPHAVCCTAAGIGDAAVDVVR